MSYYVNARSEFRCFATHCVYCVNAVYEVYPYYAICTWGYVVVWLYGLENCQTMSQMNERYGALVNLSTNPLRIRSSVVMRATKAKGNAFCLYRRLGGTAAGATHVSCTFCR